ncbi:hypothetical protein LXL04_002880 [Taraxacum kok-saghyz]
MIDEKKNEREERNPTESQSTEAFSRIKRASSMLKRAVQMRTIIGGGNGGTNLGHLFQFAADQFSDAGALLSAQHIGEKRIWQQVENVIRCEKQQRALRSKRKDEDWIKTQLEASTLSAF